MNVTAEVRKRVSKDLRITHYYHSGFSVAGEDTLFVFDYWRGEHGELTGSLQLTARQLDAYQDVFVFISHEHMDHFDPVVYTWKDETKASVSYYVASDMPVGTRGRRMAPGDSIVLKEGVTATAFDSTDLGVSFLIDFRGMKIFHAGDLNFWHWREESTMQEIEEADSNFRKAVQPLSREKIDIAFFPLDPRQGMMFEAGANYFILTAKPRILIPMHYFHRVETAMEYARTASCRSTEVIVLPGYGDALTVHADDDGYLNVSYIPRSAAAYAEDYSENRNTDGEKAVDLPFDEGDAILSEDDPFLESDLPLPQLSENNPETL